MSKIDQHSWLTDLKRRVQHYGYKYDYKARTVGNDAYLGPLPDWLASLSKKPYDDGIFPSVPDQVIVNEYLAGQGISAYIDCVPCFADTIASLSLDSPCIMEFSNPKTSEKKSIQIVYTTHSPFMVPTQNLDSVRTVNIGTAGTTVTNDPSGDSRTLFPLQAALGYDLAQSLFVGPNNLIVEGVTDFWIINSISEYLADQDKTPLYKDLTLTPAGGAQKVSYMVALLTSENLNVLVLFDDEKDSNATKDELIKTKLIQEQNIVFIS